MLSSEFVKRDISSLKKIIRRYIENRKIEEASKCISLIGKLLYTTNIYYEDSECEDFIQELSLLILQNKKYSSNGNLVMFYDSFGFENRGLAKIYMKALIHNRNIVVYYGPKNAQMKNMKQEIEKSNGVYLEQNAVTFIDKVNEFDAIIQLYKPKHLFMYLTPAEVVCPVVASAYKGSITRYMINLTDHTFWLGSKTLDIILEFRNYGASISNLYRGISKDSIYLLPYYPTIDNDVSFKGYPMEKMNNTKYVFSGGSIYKTMGGDGKYYSLIKEILERHSDIFFWYAGIGDDSCFNELKREYPGRIVITKERKDLLQVLQRARVYLSTYPIIGGLMSQYAVYAGTKPLTLLFDESSTGTIMQSKMLKNEFLDMNEMLKEIDHLLEDDEYWENTRNMMIEKRSLLVPSVDEFENALHCIMMGHNHIYPISFSGINTTEFRKQYIDRLSIGKYSRCFLRTQTMTPKVLLRFTNRFIGGSYDYFIDKKSKYMAKITNTLPPHNNK